MKKEIVTIPTIEIQAYFSDLDSLLRRTSTMRSLANLMGENVKFDITLWQDMEERTSTILEAVDPHNRAMILNAIKVIQPQYQKLIERNEHPNVQVIIEYRDKDMQLVDRIADKGIDVKGMPSSAGEWNIIVPIVRRIMDRWVDYETNAPTDYLNEVFKRLKKEGFIKGEPAQFVRMYRGDRPTRVMQWIAPNKTNNTAPNYKALGELLQELMGATSLELKDIFPRYFGIEYRNDLNRPNEAKSGHFETIRKIIDLS